MTQKVAVAVVHGVGKQDPNFSDDMTQELQDRFVEELKGKAAATDLAVRPVYWAPVIQEAENELWKRLRRGGALDFITLRHFLIDFGADAVAYQPTPHDREMYDGIHSIFAQTLGQLAADAGGKAPLCVIAHSLGSIIASNYIYDLQTDPTRKIISAPVRAEISDSALERGETLTLLYTLGSPLALWSLRYAASDYGQPITIPSPRLTNHYPKLRGEWVNFYDKDDVLGYPLKTLNKKYRKAVKADREINAGGFLSSWNPASHVEYWTDGDVIKPIAKALATLWRGVNPG